MRCFKNSLQHELEYKCCKKKKLMALLMDNFSLREDFLNNNGLQQSGASGCMNERLEDVF